MKLRFPKVTQPMLTNEFARREERRPALVKPRVVRPRVVHGVSAEADRMARRREYESGQQQKMREVARLMAGGMSRDEANRNVFG